MILDLDIQMFEIIFNCILDLITPWEAAEMSLVCKEFHIRSAKYWSGRCQRLLGLKQDDCDSVSRYIELCAISSPQATEFIESHMRGRILGRLNVGIQEFLDNGGNPADIAYGAASVNNRTLVNSLIDSPYAKSIIEAAVRGAASSSHDPRYYLRRISDYYMRPSREQALGALKNKSIKTFYESIRLPFRAAFLEELSNAGRPDLVISLEPTYVVGEIQLAIFNKNWAKLKTIISRSAEFSSKVCIALGMSADMDLIKKFISIVPPENRSNSIVTILYNAMNYHRYEIVMNLNLDNVLGDDKTWIKVIATETKDLDFIEWSKTI